MILITTAVASTLATGFSSYYIYSYHCQHFKETVFLKSVEFYSKIKQYCQNYIPLSSPVSCEHPIQITDLKIIRGDQEIINFDPASYNGLNWKLLGPTTLLHVVYQYQDQPYRIVFSYGQNLKILTDELDWLQNGLYNGIDQIQSNLVTPELDNLMTQYAGPLADLYQEAGISLSSEGFLTQDLSQKLMHTELSQNQYNAYINVTDVLGELKTFGLNLHKD